MIKIIDYGLGNISAFANVYRELDIAFEVVQSSESLASATKIILPGVGSFDKAMQLLNQSGMREMLDQKVLVDRIPVLGICVGMQMMANHSEEGTEKGLGWIDGSVKKIDVSYFEQETHLPHMGWNSLEVARSSKLLNGLEKNSRFYFLHSFYFECRKLEDVLAYATYGKKFPSIVNSNHIFGVQCHPEKSHAYGQQLLKNFSEI